MDEMVNEEKLKTDIIMGESLDGKKITLYKCVAINPQIIVPGFSRESYFAHIVFIGDFFKKSEDIKFKTVQVNYSYLDSWVNISGFNIQYSSHDDEYLIKYKLPKPVQANIHNHKVIIDFEYKGPNLSIVQRDIRIKQKTIIKIDFSEEKSLDECIDFINLVQNFLSLGVGEPVKPLEIRGITDSDKLTTNGKDYKTPIEIICATQDIPYESTNIIPQMMVFSFKDISDKFDDCLSNWIEKAELLDPVYDLYFGTLYNPHMYLEQRFLSLVQSLESYHRRIIRSSELPEIDHKNRIDLILESTPSEYKKWLKGKLEYSNEPGLRKRLREIIGRYPQIMGSKRDKTKFINSVVKIRNHLTHYSNSEDIIIRTVLKDRRQFYDLTQNLKNLIELCFLTELGFDEDEIKNTIPYKNLIK